MVSRKEQVIEEPILLETEEKLNLEQIKIIDGADATYQLSRDIKLIITNKNSNVGIWDKGHKIEIIKDKGTKLEGSFFSFNLMGVASGCGSGFISNLSNIYWGTYYESELFKLKYNQLTKDEVKKIITYILKLKTKTSWGSILSTAGDRFLKNTGYEILLDIGFKVISHYPNIQHGGKVDSGDQQSLIQLLSTDLK